MHSRLHRFLECREGLHDDCPGETRNDTCICGCHAEDDEWGDDE